ncbi:MAG: alpha-galactosidase [Clostridia bacterium]|nr:alpha-galactosidase [Clostridia bacterium]
MIFDIKSFTSKIICEGENRDTFIETQANDNELVLFITAAADKPKFIELHWDTEPWEGALILGDAWERSYGNLHFLPLSENDRWMPWYFIATDKIKSFCFGVKTGCNSFVSFRYDAEGITALVDVRNGGSGVHLGGRRLCLATFICSEYNSEDVIGCLRDYCGKLCENPILPKERIYGGNNWYYAYGKSSYEQIISDARLQVELASGTDNKPFQVIDDCWQKKKCAGPWLPNKKFRNMKKLAEEIKEAGARPGIWVRLLCNKDRRLKRSFKIKRKGRRTYLDPTHPEVKKFIRSDIERIRDWGYELIKHDFSTADLFGDFGGNLTCTITNIDSWHFYDKTKTNAEIVLDFYRLVKEAAGDMIIIGCNTVSHLSAGMVHIYRTGDDTSGKEWERTRDYGVNTLAFRMAQNEKFYMCDADCVGIQKDNIPWEKNGQWLHLLSYSNTPLFVSCCNAIGEKERADLKKAYKVFNEPHSIKPVDIFDTKIPSLWEIDGERVRYEW